MEAHYCALTVIKKFIFISSSIPQTVIDQFPKCAICYADFILEENVETLVCNHVFHRPCISNWIELNLTCPVCRRSLNRTSAIVNLKQLYLMLNRRICISLYGRISFRARSNNQSIAANNERIIEIIYDSEDVLEDQPEDIIRLVFTLIFEGKIIIIQYNEDDDM